MDKTDPLTNSAMAAPVAILGVPFDSVTTVASDLRNPETLQWNVNVERSLPGNWIATVAYVGTRGEHLYLNHELNPGVDSVRLNPDRGGIFVVGVRGDESR